MFIFYFILIPETFKKNVQWYSEIITAVKTQVTSLKSTKWPKSKINEYWSTLGYTVQHNALCKLMNTLQPRHKICKQSMRWQHKCSFNDTCIHTYKCMYAPMRRHYRFHPNLARHETANCQTSSGSEWNHNVQQVNWPRQWHTSLISKKQLYVICSNTIQPRSKYRQNKTQMNKPKTNKIIKNSKHW